MKLKYPTDWIKARKENRKITLLTAYDASMARLLATTQVDALLVGDSLGMVVQGQTSTLPVTLEEMIYHTRMVRRGAPDHFLIADMPFGSYQASVTTGVSSGLTLLKESAASAVKVEGASAQTRRTIQRLVESGVPVMGHIGLEPQSYLTSGGFRIQRAETELLQKALALEKVGCFAIVLELVTAAIAQKITQALSIPTIGIGSGPETSGQVLVLHDILGLDLQFKPRHTRVYAELSPRIVDAANRFAEEVQQGLFPGPEHSS